MIVGKIVDGRVVLPVNFCIAEDTDLTIDCVVDTGFNDYLTLPTQVVAFFAIEENIKLNLIATYIVGLWAMPTLHLFYTTFCLHNISLV